MQPNKTLLNLAICLALALPTAAHSSSATANTQHPTANQTTPLPLGLKDAWQAAIINNHGLRSKEFLWLAERDGVREAWAALLPQADAYASYGWSDYKRDYGGILGKQTETDTATRIDLGINQTLYSRSSSQNIQRAKAAEQLSAAELDAYRQHIGYLAIEAWLEISQIEADIKLINSQIATEEKRLEQLETMRQHGFASLADSLEAQASLDEIRAELQLLQSHARAARIHLQAVTGLELGSRQLQPLSTQDWRNTPLLLETDWQTQAIQHSGELQRARKEVELAEKSIKVEQGAHWPELNLGVRYNKNDSFTTNVLEETRIEVSARVPLYSGGATSARVSQARQRLTASRHQLQETENNIRVETARLTEELNGKHGRIRALHTARDSAAAALDAAEQGFTGGVRTLNELLDSRTRLSRLERELNSEIHSNIMLQYRLRMTAGSLTESDF